VADCATIRQEIYDEKYAHSKIRQGMCCQRTLEQDKIELISNYRFKEAQMDPTLTGAVIAFVGVFFGGLIGVIGGVFTTLMNIREARNNAQRIYLTSYMQQLIEVRTEFNGLLMTIGYQHSDLVKVVATAAAIAKALGDNNIPKRFTFNGNMSEIGLPIIDEVIDLVSNRINKVI
jgi:hypothetical protein